MLGGAQDTAQTDSDLNWWFAGLLAGAEHVQPLGGAGNSRVKDKDSGVGFRGKAMVALRTTLDRNLQMSLFGGVDFWSNVPYSDMADPATFATPRPARVGTSDVLDLKAGLKLTLFLNGPN